jgi:hypothetical protein
MISLKIQAKINNKKKLIKIFGLAVIGVGRSGNNMPVIFYG